MGANMIHLSENALDNTSSIENLVHWFILKENMSQKKVQKLCYYAQAWSVALLNKDIVEGIEFEAWVHGPVNTYIRRMLKRFGWRDIKITPEYLENVISDVSQEFNEVQVKLLESVWETYGNLSADELEDLTHKEEPWLEKRVGLSTFESSTRKISRKTMKKFYNSIAVPEIDLI